jgi:hypothetical protein
MLDVSGKKAMEHRDECKEKCNILENGMETIDFIQALSQESQ